MTTKILIAFLMLTGTAFGDSRVFIFRPTEVTTKQIGTINVSKTILIRYGLELSPHSKSRFVALDSKTVRLNPTLQASEGTATGFVIVDRGQPVLQVFISSRFMALMRKAVEQNVSAKQLMSREANLGMEFSQERGKLRITKVILN